MAFTLEDIVQQFGGEVVGDRSQRVGSLAPLDQAGPNQLAFLANPKYLSQVETTRAGAVLISMPLSQTRLALSMLPLMLRRSAYQDRQVIEVIITLSRAARSKGVISLQHDAEAPLYEAMKSSHAQRRQ